MRVEVIISFLYRLEMFSLFSEFREFFTLDWKPVGGALLCTTVRTIVERVEQWMSFIGQEMIFCLNSASEQPEVNFPIFPKFVLIH